MGISTSIIGIVPGNEEFKQMKAVWDACVAAKVDIPLEVESFFDGEEPSPLGAVINLNYHDAVQKIGSESGFEVDITKLPSHVKYLRFKNSW